MLTNSVMVNPMLVCADHRQQLNEFFRCGERYEREYEEIEKYEAEVTILIEDMCESMQSYVDEF